MKIKVLSNKWSVAGLQNNDVVLKMNQSHTEKSFYKHKLIDEYIINFISVNFGQISMTYVSNFGSNNTLNNQIIKRKT